MHEHGSVVISIHDVVDRRLLEQPTVARVTRNVHELSEDDPLLAKMWR